MPINPVNLIEKATPNFAKIIWASIRRNIDKPTEAIAWFSLAFSILSTGIALASIYLQFFNKGHALSIVVSSIEVKDQEVTFGVVFNNTGDYTEVVTYGSASIASEDNAVVSRGFYLENCFQPIAIASKQAIHRYYTTEIPMSTASKIKTKDKEITSYLNINFESLSSKGFAIFTNLPLGTISHNTSTGKIQQLNIPNNITAINFSTNKNHEGLGSDYIPDKWSPNPSITCRHNNSL